MNVVQEKHNHGITRSAKGVSQSIRIKLMIMVTKTLHTRQ